jgi:hypothetical protein
MKIPSTIFPNIPEFILTVDPHDRSSSVRTLPAPIRTPHD